MTRLNTSLTYLILLLSIARSVFASFAYCVGMKGLVGPDYNQTAGFRLWSDLGQQISYYDGVYVGGQGTQVALWSNRWVFYLQFLNSSFLVLANLRITNSSVTFVNVPYENICENNSTYGSLYYGCCSDDTSGYCETNRSDQIATCQTKFDMGADTIRC